MRISPRAARSPTGALAAPRACVGLSDGCSSVVSGVPAQERFDLGLRTRPAVDLHDATRERAVAFAHQQNPDPEEVDPLEDDRAFGRVRLAVREEISGHLGPVARRLDVMADVIAVVEAA